MATQLTLASFLYFLMFCATMTFSPGPMTLLLMGFGMQEAETVNAGTAGCQRSVSGIDADFAVGFAELIKVIR